MGMECNGVRERCDAVCRNDGELGWNAVEPGNLGMESDGVSEWRKQCPRVRQHCDTVYWIECTGVRGRGRWNAMETGNQGSNVME